MRRVVSGMLGMCVIVVGCSPTTTSTASVDPDAVLDRAARRLPDLVPAPLPPQTVGHHLAADCGDPVVAVPRATREHLRAVASDVRDHAETFSGVSRPSVDGPFLRVAASEYPDADAAQRVVDALTPAALERCVIDGVNTYLRDRDPGDYSPVPATTSRSFATRWVRRSGGSGPSVVQSRFDEEILGGSDNFRTVNLAVLRQGTVVVTVLRTNSAQVPEPAADARFVARTIRSITG